VTVWREEGQEASTGRDLKLLQALAFKSLDPGNLVNLSAFNVIHIEKFSPARGVNAGPVRREVGGVDGHAVKVNPLDLFVGIPVDLEEAHSLVKPSSHDHAAILVEGNLPDHALQKR